MPELNGTLKRYIGITETGPLVFDQVKALSLAIALTSLISTQAKELRFPRYTDEPSAAWVAENAEIPLSEAVADEVLVVPRKVAGLTLISNELADDAGPDAADTVGALLGSNTARRIDEAFFGPAPATTSVQPGGLEYLGDAVTTVTGSVVEGTDIYAEAIAAAEQVGVTLRGFATDPATALALAKLKSGTGSKTPLFGTGATNGIERSILGVPVYVSKHILPGTVWGIPTDGIYTVLREDVEVEIDRSVFFTSDQTAIRTKARVGFGFVRPSAVIKIKAAA
jgi:HK97 family phage major capsid protein